MNCGEIWPPSLTLLSSSQSSQSTLQSQFGSLDGSSPITPSTSLEAREVKHSDHRPRLSFAGSETDDNRGAESVRSSAPDGIHHAVPTLIHRIRHDKSILAITLSRDYIYAGTQGGEILVLNLENYAQVKVIEGHKGSVLGLHLSKDGSLLFSTASDRIINVWDARTFQRRYYLFSTYDVGDNFCVAYSSILRTVYVGLQNTAIQWYDLNDTTTKPARKSTLKDHPLWREDHPFYDSPGPGGVRTPRPADHDIRARDAKGGLALGIPPSNIRHFAHYGYVYCMTLEQDNFTGATDGEVLITGGGDGVINVWTLKSQGNAPEMLFALDDDREEGQSVFSIVVDGTFLYSGRALGEVNVWDLETKQLMRSLKSHRDDVMSVCVGGGFLFSASITGFVRKYDRHFQVATRLQTHAGKVLSSAFSEHDARQLYVTGGSDNTIAVWDVTKCIDSHQVASKNTYEQMTESLRRFVSYRTVSSDPRYKGECRRGASYLRSVFKSFGAVTEMLPTDDSNPIIYAKFRGNPLTAKDRKKVLFYGHYDVVAADNENGKWDTDPFTMEGINGYLYGRGTSDNKGPIMAAIYACAELMSEQALGADVIFLIEGEEECGSRGFKKAIRQHKALIGDIDWILLANSYWLDDRIPCLTYGLRGVIHASVQVESSHPDLHSGVDGSAKLDESLKDLVVLLSSLAGRHGEVKIPGFYEPIPELTDNETALYSDISQALMERNPRLTDSQEIAASLMRRWRDPSLTIHRFQTSGPDNATIIPRTAKAAISIRLVPNQTADEVGALLKQYLHAEFAKLDTHNVLTVTIDHQAEPWLGDVDNEIFKTLEEAVMDVWGSTTDADHGQSHHGGEEDDSAQAKSAGRSASSQPTEGSESYFGGSGPAGKVSPTTSSALASGGVVGRDMASSTSSLEKAQLSTLPPPATAPQLHTGGTAEIAGEQDSQTVSIPLPAQGDMTEAVVSQHGLRRKKPLYIREGGSIPAIRFLELEFQAPAAHLPCGQASDSAHLDNERLRLLNLYKSKDIFKRVFRDLPCR